MVDRRDDDLFLLAIAALLANAGIEDNPYVYELLRSLRRTERFRDVGGPDFDYLLERALFGPRRPRPLEELRELLASTLSSINATVERDSARVEELSKAVERLQAHERTTLHTLGDIRELTERSAADLYDLTWLMSVGGNVAQAQINRTVPTRIYFAESASDATRERVVASLDELMRGIGFDLVQRLPDEEGSWWKRLLFRSKSALSHEDVQKRLKKAERAVEAHYLAKPEAEANNLQASGAASLIAALNETDNACIQVGSLLLVKATDADGRCAVLARTLTPEEMRYIEENQSILRHPDQVLELLQSRQKRQIS